jgi:hypothetical protein
MMHFCRRIGLPLAILKKLEITLAYNLGKPSHDSYAKRRPIISAPELVIGRVGPNSEGSGLVRATNYAASHSGIPNSIQHTDT